MSNPKENEALLQLAKELAKYDENQRADMIFYLIKLSRGFIAIDEFENRLAIIEERIKIIEDN